ncbi:clip-associated protein [Anaeramoeba flamelloides]|uniref:Clip-associated protein n=1 Tax=Anaeramoeba flamelloides TaxID=1746091 RepID=A0AAV8A808_9EUKA|nr:clip-associated protein [Anaeramoeba flamelloides]
MSNKKLISQLNSKNVLSQISGCTKLNELLLKAPYLKDETFQLIIDSLLRILEDDNFPTSQIVSVLTTFDQFISNFKNRSVPYIERIVGSLEMCVELASEEEEMNGEKATLFVNDLRRLIIDILRSFIEVEGITRVIKETRYWFESEFVQVRVIALECFDLYIQISLESFPILVFLPILAKLLFDQDQQVADLSSTYLKEIYRYVGNPLIERLKALVPENDLRKFQEKLQNISVHSESQRIVLKKTKKKTKTKTKLTKKRHKREKKSRIEHNSRKTSKEITKQKNKKKSKKKDHSPTFLMNKKKKTLLSQNWSEVADKIQPIYVDSEETLEYYLAPILKILQTDKGEQWKTRISSIKKFQALLNGGAANFDSFLSWLKKFIDPINEQIQDLRSQILKQVCYLIAHLSREIGNAFEDYFLDFLDELLNLVYNSKQVIYESGDFCICEVIKFTRAPKMIPILKEKMKSKHSTLRTKCSEYTFLMLTQWKPSDFNQSNDDLEVIIEISIHDAVGACRKAGRQTFWEYVRYFPKRGTLLIQRQDNTTLKNLMNEDNAKPTLLINMKNKNASFKSKKTRTRMTKSSKSAPTINNINKITKKKLVKHKFIEKTKTNEYNFNNRIKKKYSDDDILNNHVRPKKKIRSASFDKKQRLSRVQSDKVERKKFKVSKKKNLSESSNLQSNTRNSHNNRNGSKNNHKNSRFSKEKSTKLKNTNNNQTKNENLIQFTFDKNNILLIKNDQVVKIFQNLIQSNHSITKKKILIQISELLIKKSSKFKEPNLFKLLILSLIKLLKDDDIICKINILEILVILIEKYTNDFQNYREQVLILIIPLLDNTHIGLNELAIQIMMIFGKYYTDMALILTKAQQNFNNSSNSNDNQYRLICLTFIHEFLSTLEDSYFEKNNKQQELIEIIARLSPLLDERNQDLRNPAIEIFSILFEKQKTLFIQIILKFPLSTKLVIKNLLKKVFKDFVFLYLNEKKKLDMNKKIHDMDNSSTFETKNDNNMNFDQDSNFEEDPVSDKVDNENEDEFKDETEFRGETEKVDEDENTQKSGENIKPLKENKKRKRKERKTKNSSEIKSIDDHDLNEKLKNDKNEFKTLKKKKRIKNSKNNNKELNIQNLELTKNQKTRRNHTKQDSRKKNTRKKTFENNESTRRLKNNLAPTRTINKNPRLKKKKINNPKNNKLSEAIDTKGNSKITKKKVNRKINGNGVNRSKRKTINRLNNDENKNNEKKERKKEKEIDIKDDDTLKNEFKRRKSKGWVGKEKTKRGKSNFEKTSLFSYPTERVMGNKMETETNVKPEMKEETEMGKEMVMETTTDLNPETRQETETRKKIEKRPERETQTENEKEMKIETKRRKDKISHKIQDPIKIEKMINILLSSISKGKKREQSIEMLKQLSDEKLPEIWDVHFKKIAVIIIHCFHNPEKSIRKRVLSLIDKLTENQKQYFRKSTKLLVIQLLESFEHSTKRIMNDSKFLFQKLISVLDLKITLDVLLKFFNHQNLSILQVSLNLFRDICPLLPKDAIQNKIEIILESFKKLISHKNLDIRRVVVLCIVIFYNIFGSSFEEEYIINNFQQHEIRLINICHEREKNKNQN